MSDEQDKLKLSLEPPKLFGRKKKSDAVGATKGTKPAPAKRRPVDEVDEVDEAVDETATDAGAEGTDDTVVIDTEPAEDESEPTTVIEAAEEPEAEPEATEEPEAEPEAATAPDPVAEPEATPAAAPEPESTPPAPPEKKAAAPAAKKAPAKKAPARPSTQTPGAAPAAKKAATRPAASPGTTKTASRPGAAAAKATTAKKPARRPAKPSPAVEPEPVTAAELEDAEIAARQAEEPLLTVYRAAALTGVVVGAALVLLTWLSLRGCEAIRGTSSCGQGPGFVLLVATFVVCVLLGSTLLKTFLIPDPGSSSFLAVGLVSVVALLFLIDVLDHWSMLLVIPAISVAGYLASVWVTKTFVDADST